MKQTILGFFLVIMGIMFTGCTDSSNPVSLSDAKTITAFSFTSPATEGTITETSHTIDVTVPFGTDSNGVNLGNYPLWSKHQPCNGRSTRLYLSGCLYGDGSRLFNAGLHSDGYSVDCLWGYI